jgi:hypothetical protein
VLGHPPTKPCGAASRVLAVITGPRGIAALLEPIGTRETLVPRPASAALAPPSASRVSTTGAGELAALRH